MNFTNVATIVALAAATSAYASTTSATLDITEYRAAIEKCKDSKDEIEYKTCMETEKVLPHQILPFSDVMSELKDETIIELLAKEDPAVATERERAAAELEEERVVKEAAEAAAKLLPGKRATLKEAMEAHKAETEEAKYIAALEAANVDAAVAKEAFKHRDATVDDTLLATLIPEAPVVPATTAAPATTVAPATTAAPATTDAATKIPFYKNVWFIGGSAVALLALGGGAYMLTRKSDETDL